MNKKIAVTLCFIPALTLANNEPASPNINVTGHRAQIYHTPREQREAGLETQLTDWLSLSGLAQITATSFNNSFHNAIPDTGQDNALSAVQIGFKLALSDQVESEIILDFEENKTGSVLDEAFVDLTSGNWSVSAGMQTLPFGTYYSNFITGPLLEFGETRRTTLLLGYDYNNSVEFSAFTYNGNAYPINAAARIRDWATAVEMKLLDETLLIGSSYISDVADSDARLLEDFDNRYQQRVGAWSAYAVIRGEAAEISLEILRTTHAFRELEPDADKPRAWNVEMAYYPAETWQIAARFERSDELQDQPEQRYGIAATWLAYKVVTIAVEYLHADFRQDFVFDRNNNPMHQQTLVAFELSLEF